MDSKYWVDRWVEGKIGFHQPAYHDKLIQYFPLMNPQNEQRVLVPLCGKSKDLAWLDQLGLNVHGVELFEKAAKDFFIENNFPEPLKNKDQNFIHYSSRNVTISCGDFFKLDRSAYYDLIYDRAALVALPSEMRKTYAEIIRQVLKDGGRYLLITYEYDQAILDGPPFSIDELEVHELYDREFSVRRLESQRPTKEGSRLADLDRVNQTVYLLEKK